MHPAFDAWIGFFEKHGTIGVETLLPFWRFKKTGRRPRAVSQKSFLSHRSFIPVRSSMKCDGPRMRFFSVSFGGTHWAGDFLKPPKDAAGFGDSGTLTGRKAEENA